MPEEPEIEVVMRKLTTPLVRRRGQGPPAPVWGWSCMGQGNAADCLPGARFPQTLPGKNPNPALALPSKWKQLFKRKAEGQALVVPIGREDIVETVSRQLRIDLAPELLDIGEEQLKETGEFYVPLKVVGPDGARARLEVKIMST